MALCEFRFARIKRLVSVGTLALDLAAGALGRVRRRIPANPLVWFKPL
jgi:hypothetical protein